MKQGWLALVLVVGCTTEVTDEIEGVDFLETCSGPFVSDSGCEPACNRIESWIVPAPPARTVVCSAIIENAAFAGESVMCSSQNAGAPTTGWIGRIESSPSDTEPNYVDGCCTADPGGGLRWATCQTSPAASY